MSESFNQASVVLVKRRIRLVASVLAWAAWNSSAMSATESTAAQSAPASQGAGPPIVAAPTDSIDQRAQPCMACHGKEGRATPDGYFPRIAGKPAGYLYNQLVNFRDGRRTFPMMEYLVDRQSDAYLKELANYFASQDLPYADPVPATAVGTAIELGRRLVFEGDTSRRIPSCRNCHGTQLVGVTPAVPGLLGLSQDYLIAQMGAWQNGSRHALAPDCMAEIARALGPRDIHAIAAWLSAQVVPTDAKPDSTFATPPPRDCGSIEQGSLTR